MAVISGDNLMGKQAKKSSKTSKKNNDEVHNIYLNVKQRAEVLELIKKKVSYREISAMFDIAPGTITNIKKQKDKIEEHQNQNLNGNVKKLRDDTVVNKRVFEWFCRKRSQNYAITGPMLQQKAVEVATHIDPNTKFKAANGWLSRFNERYNIRARALSGESRSIVWKS